MLFQEVPLKVLACLAHCTAGRLCQLNTSCVLVFKNGSEHFLVSLTGLLVLFTQPFVFGGKRAPETIRFCIVTMGARDVFPIRP